MSLLNVLTGAASGLAAGGPLGALAGGAAGLFGNNTGRTESGTQLRAWSTDELALLDQIMPGLSEMVKGMSPEDQSALYDKLYTAAYAPAEKAINTGFTQAGAKQDAAALLRGTGPSSTMVAGQTARLGQQAGALADASNQATLTAEQGLQGRLAGNRANASTLSGLLNTLNSGRAQGSTSYTETPGLGVTEGLAGLGNAIGDSNSWIRQNIPGLFGDQSTNGINNLVGSGKK